MNIKEEWGVGGTLARLCRAEDRDRTGMGLPPLVFETSASAYSATSAGFCLVLANNKNNHLNVQAFFQKGVFIKKVMNKGVVNPTVLEISAIGYQNPDFTQ